VSPSSSVEHPLLTLSTPQIAILRHNHSSFTLFPFNHPDVVAVTVTPEVPADPITIVCLYNPPATSEADAPLADVLQLIGGSPCLVVGDFNLHHPLWESDVTSPSRGSELFLTNMASQGLRLLTPKDLGTYLAASGRCTTIDLAFGSDPVAAAVSRITRLEDDHGSDHFGIETHLDWTAPAPAAPRPLLKREDEEAFAEATQMHWRDSLLVTPAPLTPTTIDEYALALTRTLQMGLFTTARPARPCSRSHNWFTADLHEQRASARRAR
jgi:hypothetical protein